MWLIKTVHLVFSPSKGKHDRKLGSAIWKKQKNNKKCQKWEKNPFYSNRKKLPILLTDILEKKKQAFANLRTSTQRTETLQLNNSYNRKGIQLPMKSNSISLPRPFSFPNRSLSLKLRSRREIKAWSSRCCDLALVQCSVFHGLVLYKGCIACLCLSPLDWFVQKMLKSKVW